MTVTMGAEAMASVGACMPVTQAASALAVLISVGAVRQITAASGGGNRDEANRIFSTVLILALAAGGALSLLCTFFAQDLAGFISPTPELDVLCRLYWRISCCLRIRTAS